MRKFTVFSSFVTLLMVYALNYQTVVVRADWDPDQPAKYVQMPDLSPTGMDVNATWLWDNTQPPTVTPQPFPPYVKVLADDFPCDSTGPITDIHIWGSWLNDNVNPNTIFKLSIHSDVQATPTTPSHPGDLLWENLFYPTQYVSRPWATAQESFYEPNTDKIIGTDTQVWQYNFFIDPANAFVQKGTAANKLIYWLDVQAIVPQPPPRSDQPVPDYVFGWKTSLQHFQDDAVYGDTLMPGEEPTPLAGSNLAWTDMHYPEGHPLFPQSIDLAFVITTIPEPGTMLMLLGACVMGIVAYLRRR